MKRVIVDINKLNEAILDLLITEYPNGYKEYDIIRFQNANNETIEAIEVRTEETIYLVKVGKKLQLAMEEYIEESDVIDEGNEINDYNYNDLDE